MTLVRKAALGAVCASLLAACSGGGSSAPAPSSTPTAAVSPAPAPSPTEMSRSQAGQVYLAAVCSRNAAAQAVTDLVDGLAADRIQLAKLRAAAHVSEQVNLSSADALESPPLPWPPDVRAGVTAVITIMQADAQVDHDLAAATTAATAWEVWDKHPGPTAAQRTTVAGVRSALGLDTKDGSTVGCPSPSPSSS